MTYLNLQFANFLFFYFQNQQYGKITIFIIQISLKLHLHKKMDEITQLMQVEVGPEKSQILFFAISGSSKFITHTNIQIPVSISIIN